MVNVRDRQLSCAAIGIRKVREGQGTHCAGDGSEIKGWATRPPAESGLDYVPVPKSLITCGFDEAVSLRVIVPAISP